MLALKAEFKAANGVDWVPEGGAAAPRTSRPSPPADSKPKKSEKVRLNMTSVFSRIYCKSFIFFQKEEKKKEPKKVVEKEESSGLKKQTRLGLEFKKEENLPEWYSQVIHIYFWWLHVVN